jgi:ketosteroid isomerase-like protein
VSEESFEMLEPVFGDANVEAVRRIYADWDRGEFGGGLEFFDPEIEFFIGGDVVIGFDGAHGHGIEEIGTVWGEYLSDWADFRTGGIEDLFVSGDRVVALSTLHMRGRRSGVEVSEAGAGAIFTFRDGLVTELRLTRRDKALEAAGIAPE